MSIACRLKNTRLDWIVDSIRKNLKSWTVLPVWIYEPDSGFYIQAASSYKNWKTDASSSSEFKIAEEV